MMVAGVKRQGSRGEGSCQGPKVNGTNRTPHVNSAHRVKTPSIIKMPLTLPVKEVISHGAGRAVGWGVVAEVLELAVDSLQSHASTLNIKIQYTTRRA